jgi:hypothetical protein
VGALSDERSGLSFVIIAVLLATAFYTRSVQRDNWKEEATIQNGLERGRTGITVLRSRYQKTSSEDNAGWEDLACASNL